MAAPVPGPQVIRTLSALGFGLIGAGLFALAVRLFPGLALALQETEAVVLAGVFVAGFAIWLLGFGSRRLPSPGRGAVLGLIAAVLANPLAVALVAATADSRGAEPVDGTGILVLAVVGAVETGPVSLPVAALTGAFYALLLGLLVRDRLRP